MLTSKNWQEQLRELKYCNAFSGRPNHEILKSFISNLLQTFLIDVAGKEEDMTQAGIDSGGELNITQRDLDYEKGLNKKRQEVLKRGERWLK